MFKRALLLPIMAVSGVLLFFSLIPAASAQTPTIHSVPAGGSWSNSITWVENTVPGPNDVVEINGTITLDGSVSVAGLVISAGAILQNDPNYETLTVNGDVLNNGTTRDNISYNWLKLTMSVTGNITNNGTWGNYWTDLRSNQARTIDGSNSIDSNITLYDDFSILNSPVF